MTRAKFKLDFKIEACFDIDKEIETVLPDGSKIILHKSNVENLGTILYEADRPDTSIAMNEGKHKVENFFNWLLVTKDSFENLKPIEFPQQPELLNREDFKGQRITVIKPFVIGYIAVTKLEQQEIKNTNELLAEISKLPQDEKDILARSMRWFRKASEIGGEDRFVYSWISLEALLGLLKKEKSTQELICLFINEFLKPKTAQEIFNKHQKVIEDLSKANLKGYHGTKYSEQLLELLKKDADSKAVLQKAVLCVYEVRNKLFHKGIADLAIYSSSFLRDIIKVCLKSYIQRS